MQLQVTEFIHVRDYTVITSHKIINLPDILSVIRISSYQKHKKERNKTILQIVWITKYRAFHNVLCNYKHL